MASPSGSSEDSAKLRGRDGRQRREEEDAPPEEKRLKLGLEGGSAAQEEEDAPRLGREETGTQTGGEGRGDHKCESSALLSGARISPQDSVLGPWDAGLRKVPGVDSCAPATCHPGYQVGDTPCP
ncbi:uncharacterized protein LOC115300045 [Suricata suricatta]|uniref:uncharacterized protein LOC115300045 n=1 Tax=Suricata suricatta TaxID=37032 RepID=UPI0011554AA1|nr:uncharacterized protein LOC115300045 [Suricata suricatta]